jgi:uncharacterized iron-regulated membrane protein
VSFFQRPQATWIRGALFQIHLWMGIAVALYVCLIGITGAALVFRPEMQKATFPGYFVVDRLGEADAPADDIIRRLQSAYPGAQLAGIDYPTARRGTYLSYLTRGSQLLTVFSNPITGQIVGELPTRSWITWLQDLHFDLLAGHTGRIVNGVAAISLVLMFATGLVVWWPGVDRWRKSLAVDFRKNWKRINWELHGAIGFWLFALLMLWAVTGIEFAFPRQFRQAVNAVSPLSVARTPQSSPRPGGQLPEAEITALIARAHQIVPGARMGRVVLPSTGRAPILLLMAYIDHGDFDRNDEVSLYFDQYTGQLLERRDQALVPQTAGDLTMKWIGPLHLGSFGGLGVKVLWSILALSFPALAITGVLMWWFRVVRPSLNS